MKLDRFGLCLLAGALGTLTACLPSDLVENDLDRIVVFEGQPIGWSGTLGVGTTSTAPRSGRTNAYLANAAQGEPLARVMGQYLRADQYRGKRVRLSGWLRPRSVGATPYSGLWMRVDGPTTSLAFDNMANRAVTGNGDWRQVSVVLDVDSAAVAIAFGAQFQGTNMLLVDDLTLEVVDHTVPSTNVLTAPTPTGLDSAATAQQYSRRAIAPTNLGFEGLEAGGSATAEWIRSHAAPLTTTDPTAPLTDLDTLRSMIGSARVVGLGEATHGTREFFLLKDRMVRYLVTRMGFTTFAIEASAPEADELNDYVLNGVGTPSLLLFNLRFWIWDTRELLDLIRWMREWNLSVPAAQRVQFRGIDIQYPGASMDSVRAFLARESPSDVHQIDSLFQCMTPYRNHGATPGRNRNEYAFSASSLKAACAAGLTIVHALVSAQRTDAPGFARTVHHARLVQQFENMAAQQTVGAINRSRDAAMAENATWLHGQSGGTGTIVWAHNDHVTRQDGAMGAHLAARHGSGYRPMGFAYGTGSFYAVLIQNAELRDVRVHTSAQVRSGSVEQAFMGAESPLLLLDMRRTLAGEAGSDPLRRPMVMRNIGSAFDPQSELSFYSTRVFPADFDLLMWVRSGTPATSLPVP